MASHLHVEIDRERRIVTVDDSDIASNVGVAAIEDCYPAKVDWRWVRVGEHPTTWQVTITHPTGEKDEWQVIAIKPAAAPVVEDTEWEPTRAELAAVRQVPARLLEPYLEHSGDINPDGYLEEMVDLGLEAEATDPVILGVYDNEDGTENASIWDGNHRLLVALARGANTPVWYAASRNVESTHPGYSYDGELG